MKIKVLLFIYQLSGGGAEKILTEIANNLDNKFDVTVRTILDCSNERYRLNSNIKYEYCFKKKFRFDRLFFKVGYFLSPKILYKLLILKKYDIEIAAMEGIPSKVISGCKNKNTKLISIIHASCKNIAWPKNRYFNKNQELKSYSFFDKLIFVSNDTEKDFLEEFNISIEKCKVMYNPFDINYILNKSNEKVDDLPDLLNRFTFCTVGRIEEVKGFERLVLAMKENIKLNPRNCLVIIGDGKLRIQLMDLIISNGLQDHIYILGYKENPYPYIKVSDCYVCSSFSEGLSTSVIEALILSKPVVTTHGGGMIEILNNGEYGLIVDNSLEGIIRGLRESKVKNCYYLCQGEQLKKYVTMYDKKYYFKKFEELIMEDEV